MTTIKTTPVSLSIRPFQVSHLSFEVGGILEVVPAQLGAKVSAFDFPAFYAILGAVPTVAGDPSRLLYNFLQIDAVAAPFALAALRKEARKAALNNAINARQNAFFAKYANAPAVIIQMNQAYSPSITGSKTQRLEVLTALATDQWNQLKAAYIADPIRNPSAASGGLVKTTNSALCSDTASYGYSATGGVTAEMSATATNIPEKTPVPTPPNPPAPWAAPSWPAPCNASGQTDGSGNNLPSPPPPAAPVDTWSEGFTGGIESDFTIQKSATYQATSSADKARQYQTIVNTDYGFRVPYYEAAAQFERAQISLVDQTFSQFMYTQNFPKLATVFQNELNSIDSNVFSMQVAYANTILMSPIAGLVTGVYKNPGDAVRAGEPVARVEDNSTVYLIATIVHRGPIVIAPPPPAPPPLNSTVKVSTSLFGASGPLTSLTGSVVSARGHRDDDKWDLVVKCTNPLDASGTPTFPLGYHFDFDDTTVSIT
jgi:biotin carboxyl carrier protein